MQETSLSPFVLRGMRRVPSEPQPRPEHVYDETRQLWVSAVSGRPLVLEHVENGRAEAGRSDWGETVMTKTSEGVDQSEGTRASDFGETVVTRSGGEGQDQTEALQASKFGETLMTETGEGVDRAETIGASEFGETIITATSEGVDQSERTVSNEYPTTVIGGDCRCS